MDHQKQYEREKTSGSTYLRIKADDTNGIIVQPHCEESGAEFTKRNGSECHTYHVTIHFLTVGIFVQLPSDIHFEIHNFTAVKSNNYLSRIDRTFCDVTFSWCSPFVDTLISSDMADSFWVTVGNVITKVLNTVSNSNHGSVRFGKHLALIDFKTKFFFITERQ